MTKKEAVSIITNCAARYAANLCNRQLAFVYRDGRNQTEFIEVTFRPNNFMHLTGIETIRRPGANAFYRDVLDKRLKEDIRDIIPKPPGKIFAIFRGSVGQENYDELTFRSGSLGITKKCLPPSLLEKTDPALFIPETESPQI